MRFLPLTLVSLVVTLALAPAPAGATSYVLMSDEALADGADLVVEARVAEIRYPGLFGDRPVTEYVLDSVDTLIGEAPAELSVRVLGGPAGGGLHLSIQDAPWVASGERAIWFLTRRADATWEPYQFGLGVFRRVDRASGDDQASSKLAARSFLNAPWGEQRSGNPPAEARGLARDYDAFAQWLRARGAGLGARPLDRGPDRSEARGYLVAAEPAKATRPASPREIQAAVEEFVLFGFRWCEFDTAGSVTWLADSDGFPGATFNEYTAFQNALQAWEDDPRTPVSLPYGGTTTLADDGINDGFLNQPDGTTAITFDDPNDEIVGSFSCMVGGVLAIGGSWFSGADCNGYDTAVEGEVVIQDGSACFYNGNGGTNADEVFAHEIGHSLGFRHPDPQGNPITEPEALMRWFAHADGRGALLTNDDFQSMDFLYGDGSLIYADGFDTGTTALWN